MLKPSDFWPDDVNLTEFLVFRRSEDQHGQEVALLYESEKISYAKLAEQIRRVARVLAESGISCGDRVILLLPDTPAFVFTFFAAIQIGAIAVPINPSLGHSEVVRIATKTTSKMAVVAREFADKFKSLKAAGLAVLVSGDGSGRLSELDVEASKTDSGPMDIYRSPGAIAYCLFSSGTTGEPKGIPHTHSDILECIRAYSLPILHMQAGDRVLAVPKLTFGYGLGGNLLSSLYVGAASILVKEVLAGDVLVEALDRFLPTLLLAQPRNVAELVRRFPEGRSHSLRLAVSAGEVLAGSLYRAWKASFNVELLDGFGSTEVGHVFITNRVGDVQQGCAGRVVDGFEVKIVDDSGVPLPSNSIGHLWVRGPSLAKCYWNDAERTADSFKDGWVRTGDLFSSDTEGYLSYCGRSDEMIKAGCGQWVSPIELESILLEDSRVCDCAVVGCSDDFGIVRPKAYIVLSEGTTPAVDIERDLMERVASRFPEFSYKHLSAVEFACNLPRSVTGKLQRFRLHPKTLSEFSFQC